MMHKFKLKYLFIIVLLFGKSIASSESIRCDGSLIGVGDLRIKVEAKCGEPDDKIEYTKFTIVHNKYLKRPSLKNDWMDKYIVQYKNEEAYKEELEKFKEPDHSHDSLIDDLDGSPHVIKKNKKIKHEKKSSLQESDLALNNKSNYTIVWTCTLIKDEYEEWVYNMGPTQFMRVVTFAHGRVINVETTEYGFEK
ncbi:MAG: DUF2845 domain-containing protein [Leptospirales bacterium]